MNRILLSLTLVVSAAALACGDAEDTHGWWAPTIGGASVPTEPRSASVDELAKWTKAKTAVPVDANGKQLRASEGVIPGAVLLTSSASYELKELPANKSAQLVFYCANEKCTASHLAARRAMDNGYTNVAILPAGIKGWKAAGQPTKPTPRT